MSFYVCPSCEAHFGGDPIVNDCFGCGTEICERCEVIEDGKSLCQDCYDNGYEPPDPDPSPVSVQERYMQDALQKRRIG